MNLQSLMAACRLSRICSASSCCAHLTAHELPAAGSEQLCTHAQVLVAGWQTTLHPFFPPEPAVHLVCVCMLRQVMLHMLVVLPGHARGLGLVGWEFQLVMPASSFCRFAGVGPFRSGP